MKKKISFVMALTALVSMFSAVSASAATNAYYDDVRAYINNTPIQSYSIDSHTCVSTNDLKDYGFRVDWDGNSRAIYINREYCKDIFNPGTAVNYKAYKGDVAFKLVPSDVKVYVNGELVTSYHNGAEVYIQLGSLVKASNPWKGYTIDKTWFADERQSFLWISDIAIPEKGSFILAHLKAPKAYELAKKALAESIYAGVATLEKVAFVYGSNDAIYDMKYDGVENETYLFELFCNTEYNTEYIQVNQDGTTSFVNIPDYVTYHALHN